MITAAQGGIYADLRGRHILITGGSSGIGAGIASAFEKQGAAVSVLDILPVETHAARSAISYARCDLTDPADIERAISAQQAAIGNIDILINNAARDDRHTLAETDAALWDELIAVNLRAYHLTIRAVVPDMKRNGDGIIVNLSSNSFMLGLAGYPVYATAKAGIWGMTRALARELGEHSIRVNCLVPGWVMTERQKTQHATPKALQDCLNAQCLKSEIQPEDIANACLFLASDASRMMTGQMLVVDGGRA